MKDKVANVYLSSLSMLSTILESFAHHVGAKEIESASEMVMPHLVEKLGDTNTRLRCGVCVWGGGVGAGAAQGHALSMSDHV
jgi:hypothetical protein